MPDKKIMGLMGYIASDVLFEPMEVIAEIETNNIDSDGYQNMQTLGVAKDQYNSPCLFIGSIQNSFPLCTYPTLNFGEEVKTESIPAYLRALADEIELSNFQRIKSYKGFDIDVFDTGDKTSWCVEVKKNNKIISEHYRIDSEIKAYREAKIFCDFMIGGVNHG